MKRFLRLSGIVLVVLMLGLVACIPLASNPRPIPESGKEMAAQADTLARMMERAVNRKAWDETAFVRWNFLGQHEHLWDKRAHRARVRWGSYEVYLNPTDKSGRAWKKGQELEGKAREKAVTKALDYFFNDSFWLNAPCKAFDEGVERGVVFGEDGSAGLLLEYGSGGITPGDAYLWTLRPDGLPLRWNMWVEVLPVKGLGNSWEVWDTLYSGALIARVRAAGPFRFTMIRDLDAAASLAELEEAEDAMAEWRFMEEKE